jgi:hypothetical protein
LAGNPVLLRQVSPLAEDAALGRLAGEEENLRRYADFRYAAKSWTVERRAIARVEAGPQGPTAAASSPTCRVCRNPSTRRSIAPQAGPRT